MGQYFEFYNADRNESFRPPSGGLKAVETVTNPGCVLLAYLVLEGPQDGTMFGSKNADPDALDLDALRAEVDAGTLPESVTRWIDRAEDDPEDRWAAARIAESHRQIRERNEFAGRWAGDRISLVGDYSETGNYDAASTDISEGVAAEWEWFTGKSLSEWETGDLRPDTVISSTSGP